MKIINDERPMVQKMITSVEANIKRVEENLKKEWSEIKDFTVSATRADEGYRRMKKARTTLKKLNTERRKLEKKLLNLNTPEYAKD